MTELFALRLRFCAGYDLQPEILKRMRNKERWQPSKFVIRQGRLIASRNPREVDVASRLVADLVASCYQPALAEHAKGRLLDLGCGKVPLYGAYAGYVIDNVCVDWGNSLHRNEYLDHEVDLTKDLPFRDSEFDTIILSDVLEHIPVPEQVWKEMARVLAPGGKVILNVPFFYPIHESPFDFHRYTEFALQRLAQGAGMEVMLLRPIGGAPEIMTDIFAKNVLLVPVVGRMLCLLVQSLTARFIRTRLGSKVSRVTGVRFPLGYFMVARKVGHERHTG